MNGYVYASAFAADNLTGNQPVHRKSALSNVKKTPPQTVPSIIVKVLPWKLSEPYLLKNWDLTRGNPDHELPVVEGLTFGGIQNYINNVLRIPNILFDLNDDVAEDERVLRTGDVVGWFSN